MTYEAVFALAAVYDDWNAYEAVQVAFCESQFFSGAVSYAGAVGLYQDHPAQSGDYDPAINTMHAHAKYVDAGHSWYPWYAFGSCGRFSS